MVQIYPERKYVVEIPTADVSGASALGRWLSLSDASPVRMLTVTGTQLPALLGHLATLRIEFVVKDYDTAAVIHFPD